jgi:hypothetical protein
MTFGEKLLTLWGSSLGRAVYTDNRFKNFPELLQELIFGPLPDGELLLVGLVFAFGFLAQSKKTQPAWRWGASGTCSLSQDMQPFPSTLKQ